MRFFVLLLLAACDGAASTGRPAADARGAADATVASLPDATVASLPDAPTASLPDAPTASLPDAPTAPLPDARHADAAPPDAAPPDAAPPDAGEPAGPHANDECRSAEDLTGNGSISGTLRGDGKSASGCNNTDGPDRWYKITVASPGVLYADTFGSAVDTVIGVFPSCGLSRTCADDACGTRQEQVLWNVQSGTYYLSVAQHGATGGDFVLHTFVARTGNVRGAVPAGDFDVYGKTGDAGAFSCSTTGEGALYYWLACPDDPGGTFTAYPCSFGWDHHFVFMDYQHAVGPGTQCTYPSKRCGVPFETTIKPGAGAYVFGMTVDGLGAGGDFSIIGLRP